MMRSAKLQLPKDRRSAVRQSTNDVTGTFVLGDHLDIETTTGKVDLTPDLEPRNDHTVAMTAPFKLSVRTLSGSIRITLSNFTADHQSHNEPWPNLETRISSESGSINVRTLSGSIRITLSNLTADHEPQNVSWVEVASQEADKVENGLP